MDTSLWYWTPEITDACKGIITWKTQRHQLTYIKMLRCRSEECLAQMCRFVWSKFGHVLRCELKAHLCSKQKTDMQTERQFHLVSCISYTCNLMHFRGPCTSVIQHRRVIPQEAAVAVLSRSKLETGEKKNAEEWIEDKNCKNCTSFWNNHTLLMLIPETNTPFPLTC